MLVIFSSRSGSDAIHVFEALKAGQIRGHSLEDVSKVVTNNINSPLIKYCYDNGINVSVIPKRPNSVNYGELGIPSEDTILLMGYLRVLPSGWVGDRPNTYNLHPGAILEYPELKGLDPQKRAFEGQYKHIGCVIHKVIPEVDEGNVVDHWTVNNDCQTLDDMYVKLGDMAKKMWVEFLNRTSW